MGNVPGEPAAEVSRWTSRSAVALGVLALALVSVMVVLGMWQLSAFDDRQQRDGEKQLEREPIPLAAVMGPDEAYPSDAVGRPVTVDGRYVASEQVYVEGLPGHDDAYAVVTPLIDATGSGILVVRGSSDDRNAPPPSGPVRVEGILEPSTATGGPVNDRRVTDGIRVAALISGFDRDLYSGYVVLRESDPGETLPAVQPPIPDPSLFAGLRNLAYALQWWVFAAFVVFMWWRIVGEEDDQESDRRPAVDVG